MGIKIDFYCGIGERKWNHHPVATGPLACVSPVVGSKENRRSKNYVYVPENTSVIVDSGAFSDGPTTRVSFEEALQRQLNHMREFCYTDKVTHLASYDLLIDEKWLNGQRYKERWTEEEAEVAVKTTLDGVRWLSEHRQAGKGLILNAQGVSPEQYKRCVGEILPYLQTGDVLGLGGWCIIGKRRKVMTPVFKQTIDLIMPMLEGLSRLHIWGVIYPPALAYLGTEGAKRGISLSTDSVGPSIKPALGAWGYGDWCDSSYRRPPTDIRGLERARHVALTREWLNNFPAEVYLKSKYLN